MFDTDVLAILKELEKLQGLKIYGRVKSIRGLLISIEMNTTLMRVGSHCRVEQNSGEWSLAEIVSFNKEEASVMAFGSIHGIQPGAYVCLDHRTPVLYPHQSWRGRIINALGEPLDHLGPLDMGEHPKPFQGVVLPANQRTRVHRRLDVGIRAINTFLTTCIGQRMGIFAGSGVGKSMLLSMLARHTACDVCIIGLVGERGREVKEFIEDVLGEEGLKKSVVVVATSDESPMMRRQAAYTTLTIAEYFRDQSLSVLCVIDSMTRFAMAQREIGLSLGEPPTTKGYTPSVFTEFSKILERAGPGTTEEGGITGFFTILVDGDDHNEPIADAARAILDGHIVLDRKLAEKGHYPSIRILKSISRMVPSCHSASEQDLVKQARNILSTYEEMEDFIRLGAYKEGNSSDVDQSIIIYPKIMSFLSQGYNEKETLEESFEKLQSVLN